MCFSKKHFKNRTKKKASYDVGRPISTEPKYEIISFYLLESVHKLMPTVSILLVKSRSMCMRLASVLFMQYLFKSAGGVTI